MAILEILEYPDPRLRTVATPVGAVDDDIRELVASLLETMYAAPGIGLAATQVDVHKRLLVIDISEDQSEPLVFINPEILETEGLVKGDEGCLSVPEMYEPVERAECVRVKALNSAGESFEMEAEGLLATCIQHELDHLEGKLFIDYLSAIKRQRLKKKLAKARKREATSSPRAL